MTEPPPPRYRVVERDRRLVVIDMAAGSTAEPDAPTPSSPAWLPRQMQFDGSAELITHGFYDDKAPRTIRLDPGTATLIGRLKLGAVVLAVVAVVVAITNVWLLLPVFLLWNTGVRKALRRHVTGWLDTIEREAG